MPIGSVRPGGVDARRITRILVVAIASLLALGSAVAALTVLHAPHASLGFGEAGLTVIGVAPDSAAARAGLRAGDQLAPDTPVSARLRAMWYDAYAPGQTESVTVERNGLPRTVTLEAVRHPPPFDATSRRITELRLLAYALFILTGAALVILRPARFTWAFFACCLGLANFPALIGWSMTFVNPALGIAAYIFWSAAADVASVAFLAFALLFPADELAGWRRTAWRTLPFWLLGFLAVDAWTTVAWYDGISLSRAVVWCKDAAGLALWSVGAFSLVGTYRSASPPDRRRLQWAIVGSAIGALAWYVERLLVHGGLSVPGSIVGVATIAMPLSLGYAVLKHRVVDVRFVLNRALTYSVLASALVVLFTLSSWFVAVTLQRQHVQVLVQVVLALIVGASLHRAHRRIESFAERILFRRLRTADSTLAHAEEGARSASSLDALESLLASAPLNALDLESSAVYRRRADGSYVRSAVAGDGAAYPTSLREQDSPANALATSLRDGPEQIARIFFGAHRNGLALDPDEVALLERFVNDTAEEYRRLAARTAGARRLSELLRAPEEFADASFAKALGLHIVDQLSPEDRALLTACAIVPDAALEDVTSLAGGIGAASQFIELAATTDFVERSADGRYAVHSLLRPILTEHAASTSTAALVTRAAECAAAGEFLRAAELAAAAGDRQRALSWLEAAGAQVNPISSAVVTLVAEATGDELAACPNVVVAYAQQRWLLEADPQLRATARRALDRVRDGSSRAALAAWVALTCAENGELVRADRALALTEGADTATIGALIAAKRGLFDRCERLARDAEARGAVGPGLPPPALIRAIEVERSRGRWAHARALLDELLGRVSNPALRLVVLAESAFTAWLAGDDERATVDANALLTASSELNLHALDFVALSLLGRACAPYERSIPRFAAYAALVEGLRATSSDEAAESLRSALTAATTACEPFLRILAYVCLHETGVADGDECLAEAASLADAVESAALAAAVAATIGGFGDGGVLAAVLRRARASRPVRPSLTVEIATGTVRRGADVVAVSDRELALLVALGRSTLPQPAAPLVDLLWPGLDEDNGTRALQTCVYRVRQRLGGIEAIEYVAQGYRLGSHATVDLVEAERFVQGLPAAQPLGAFARLRLEALASHFGLPRAAATHEWEWFDPLERRVAAVARTARRRLAAHYLERGEYQSALRYAHEMLSVDDFDETARELIARIHAAAGDGPEQHRERRRYEELLARE